MLLSILLPSFFCGTFDYYAAFECNYGRNLKEARICEIRSITYSIAQTKGGLSKAILLTCDSIGIFYSLFSFL